MRKLGVIVFAALLAGCMAMIHGTADQLDKISVGMSRADVVKVLGPPKTVSANGGVEYLQYRWVKTVIATDANWPDDYYVAVKNGKVSAYGRKGDFDSTQTPTQRVEVDKTVRDVSPQNQNKDLYTELKKLKDLKDSGVITDAEFEAQKKKLLSAN